MRSAPPILRCERRRAAAMRRGGAAFLDRQEKGTGELSAIQEIEQTYQISVTAIISLQNIIDFLEGSSNGEMQQHLSAVIAYRDQYGV